jgi:hypothetical protein
MRKMTLILALGVMVTTGAAFADHPSGWGIGVVGGLNGGWGGGAWPGLTVSLKVPSLPIYWGIGVGINRDSFSLGVTGDYYFYDRQLVPEIGLNWYLGLGGYFNAYFSSSGGVSLGGRLPIGLSWQPLKPNVLELFLDIAPSLGIGINTGSVLAGGWGGDFGIRFWL